MSRTISSLLLATAFTMSACSSAPPGYSTSANSSTHQLVKCQRYAPTGSRIRTHVGCDDRGGYGHFKVRTWSDIEKERQ